MAQQLTGAEEWGDNGTFSETFSTQCLTKCADFMELDTYFICQSTRFQDEFIR